MYLYKFDKHLDKPLDSVEKLLSDLPTLESQNILKALHNDSTFDWEMFVRTVRSSSFGLERIEGEVTNMVKIECESGYGFIHKATVIDKTGKETNVVMKQLKPSIMRLETLRMFAKEFILSLYLGLSQTSEDDFIKCIGYCYSDNRFHIVYEKADSDLFLMLRATHFLDDIQKERILLVMYHIIRNLHNHHIVHFDIKPENFLYCIESQNDKYITKVKMADFGSSCLMSHLEFNNGTVEYMLPSFITKDENPILSDIFAYCVSYINCFGDYAKVKNNAKIFTLVNNSSKLSPFGKLVHEILREFKIAFNRRSKVNSVVLEKWLTLDWEIPREIPYFPRCIPELSYQYSSMLLDCVPNFKLIRFLNKELKDVSDVVHDINYKGKYLDVMKEPFNLMVINHQYGSNKGLYVIYNNPFKVQEFIKYILESTYEPNYDIFPLVYTKDKTREVSKITLPDIYQEESDLDDLLVVLNSNNNTSRKIKESKHKIAILKNQDSYLVLYPDELYLKIFLRENEL